MTCKSILNIRKYSEFRDQIGASILLNNISRRGMSITIDDGPSPRTLPILRFLKRENLRATFFVLGKQIERYPEIAHVLSNSGHDICVHGLNHTNIDTISPSDFLNSLREFEKIAQRHGIRFKKIFRPPQGEIGHEQIKILKDAGYKIVLWSLDSFDWMGDSKKCIDYFKTQNDLSHIVLFHDGLCGKHYSTLKSLLRLVEMCKKKNTSIVPIDIGA